MKFISHEVVLYLYKSTIQSSMEQCCHVSAGAPFATWNCWINYKRTVGPLLGFSLEHLAQNQNVASFYSYYFGRCSSELAELAPLPYY